MIYYRCIITNYRWFIIIDDLLYSIKVMIYYYSALRRTACQFPVPSRTLTPNLNECPTQTFQTMMLRDCPVHVCRYAYASWRRGGDFHGQWEAWSPSQWIHDRRTCCMNHDTWMSHDTRMRYDHRIKNMTDLWILPVAWWMLLAWNHDSCVFLEIR